MNIKDELYKIMKSFSTGSLINGSSRKIISIDLTAAPNEQVKLLDYSGLISDLRSYTRNKITAQSINNFLTFISIPTRSAKFDIAAAYAVDFIWTMTGTTMNGDVLISLDSGNSSVKLMTLVDTTNPKIIGRMYIYDNGAETMTVDVFYSLYSNNTLVSAGCVTGTMDVNTSDYDATTIEASAKFAGGTATIIAHSQRVA